MADISLWLTYFWSSLVIKTKQYPCYLLVFIPIAIIVDVLVRVIQGNKISRWRFYTYSCILKNWLTRLWGLANLKSVEQASRLEIQEGLNAAGLKQNFFSEKPQFLLFGPPTNWRKPKYITEGNLFI